MNEKTTKFSLKWKSRLLLNILIRVIDKSEIQVEEKIIGQ
jgi:hypothetical protein